MGTDWLVTATREELFPRSSRSALSDSGFGFRLIEAEEVNLTASDYQFSLIGKLRAPNSAERPLRCTVGFSQATTVGCYLQPRPVLISSGR